MSDQVLMDPIYRLHPTRIQAQDADGKLVEYRLHLVKDDHITKQIQVTTPGRPYELDLLEKIRDLTAKRRGAFIDVGAHVGNHACYFKYVCGAQIVYCFEPHPLLFAHLAVNCPWAVLSNSPVSCVRGLRTSLSYPESSNLGMTRVVPSTTDPTHTTVRIDSLALPIEVVVVKIDVEGMELDVLDGAKELIATDRPIVVVESHTAQRLMEIKDFFLMLGRGKSYNTVLGPYCKTPTYIFTP